MRRRDVWAAVAALAVFGAGAAAADPVYVKPPKFGKGPGLIGQLFQEEPPPVADADAKPEPKAQPKPDKAKDKGKAKAADKPKAAAKDKSADTEGAKEPDVDKAAPKPLTTAERAANERSREEAKLLRRLAVCDKLMEIALDTHDDDLQRLAGELDERARLIYAQRVARLPAGAVATEGEDERILDKQLGTAAAKTGTDAALTAKPGRDAKPAARAAALEVKP